MHYPTLEGEVILTLRDKDTLEVKQVLQQKNAITLYGITAIMSATAASWLGGTYMGKFIQITERLTSTGFIAGSGVNRTFNSDDDAEDSETSPWTFTAGSPDFVQKTGRFLAPATDRTINTIYLTGAVQTAQRNVFSVASLSTPCVQTTSEVLDITYRIELFYQSPLPGAIPVSFDFDKMIARRLAGNSVPVTPIGQLGGFPYLTFAMACSAPPDPDLYQGMTTQRNNINNGGTSDGGGTMIKSHGKVAFNQSQEIADNIGRVFKTMGYGTTDNFGADYWDAVYAGKASGHRGFGNRSTVWAPIAPDSFINKPVQTIHNHSASADEWGLDVDNLATSQGTLTIDGSSWTDLTFPEFYRIDHTFTGETGVSRYAFRKRYTLGFNGSGYAPQQIESQIHQLWQMKNAADDGILYQTIVDGHGLKQRYKIAEYNEDTFMTWDLTGITLANINSSAAVHFDSATTPALPVTDVRQIAVDSAGGVWVACGATGLYRIDDPFGTPTVTKMTEATNSLVGGSEDNAYAVAIGFGGDIFALVEGGLISTSNPTGGTPTFSTESFTYTGVSDANWSRVIYMRMDADHPDFQLGLAANLTDILDTVTTVWWDNTAPGGITGPVQSGSTGEALGELTGGLFECSARGGYWTRVGALYTGDHIQNLTWGTTSVSDIGHNALGRARPAYFYDYYDTPYSIAGGQYAPSVYSHRNKKYSFQPTGGQTWQTSQSFKGFGLALQTGSGKGYFMTCANQASTTGTMGGTAHPNRIFPVCPSNYLDPLNGQHSPLEEMAWDRYHWNGAAWELNYFADAIDTGFAGGIDGSRENFDTEDHTFTGRSMIDVTDVFATGNFASTAVATFAFKLIPEAKLSAANDSTDESAQEKPRVLLDVSDATQQFQIVWDSSIQGNIQIVEDGSATTIVSTPANSSTYRLIVIVNGTSVDVYLDDAVIGSTVTFDWSNGSSDLKAFVGCEVYAWEQLQRHTPWQNNFYRGVMTNVQIWNSAWDAADVASDFSITGGGGTIAGGTEPLVNQIRRFELTQSLATLETKLSHAGAEALLEGLTIAFVDGGGPDAFVATDYHTFGVVDGILKDNATDFTQQFSIYFLPTDLEFSTFKNASGTSLIENATTAVVDEPACWINVTFPPLDTVKQDVFNPNSNTKHIYSIPGQIGMDLDQTNSFTGNFGAITVQHISADGYFEGGPAVGDENTTFGLTDDPSGTHSSVNIEFGIRLVPDGSVDIVEANVVVSSGIGTYVVGDIFRVRRIGTAVTYYKNGGLIFTSGNTSSGDVHGRVHINEEGYSLRDCKITYTRPALVMSIGDPGAFDGVYDPDYFRVETLTVESLDISIAGSPATVVVDNDIFVDMTLPGPGEVVVNGRCGWMFFNAADVGSAVTGEVTVIFLKP